MIAAASPAPTRARARTRAGDAHDGRDEIDEIDELDELDALEALLAPQERFERLRAEAVLRSGRALCDLAYANAYDGPPAVVLEALARAVSKARRPLDLQYTPYGGATVTRRLVADQLARRTGLAFGAKDVVMTPGAMAALNVVFRALHGTVLVIAPCWLDTPLYLANLGLHCVLVPVRATDHRLDLAAIADALRAHDDVSALVLSQPANPTGVVYTRDELRAVADLLRTNGRGALWISDECHRDLAFNPQAFSSPAEHYDDTCVVYSFGKTWFMQGQRIGYAAVSPACRSARALARTLERNCRTLGVCTPTSLMQLAVRDLLDVKPDVVRVAERSALVYAELRSAGYPCAPPDGTFFLYPRAPIDDDVAFCERLAHAGVLVMPSSLFHARGHFRVAVTATDEMIVRALPILRAHAGGSG